MTLTLLCFSGTDPFIFEPNIFGNKWHIFKYLPTSVCPISTLCHCTRESKQSIFSIEYIMKNSYILVNMGPLANIDLIVSPLQRSASQTRRKNILL